MDILDNVKSIEKKAKAKLLVEAMIDLKKKIRKMAVLKLECDIALEEIGITKSDRKRILDFLKELPETKVDKDEVQQMKKDKQKEVAREKDNIMQNLSISNLGYTTTTSSGGYKGSLSGDTILYNDSTNAVNMVNDSGNKLEVKL